MSHELESQAAVHIGGLVLAFSRLDFMLALALRNMLSGQRKGPVEPLIERLGFKARLDAIRDVVRESSNLSDEAKVQIEAWHARADQLRCTRNAFVHGRWGVETRDALFNASTKTGRTFSGESKVYSDLAPEKRSSWLMMESETGATR